MQHDLFPQSGLSIIPEAGRQEPRLWVRKLVIWEKPDQIIREIDLRPGLNIVWSPDPGTDEARPIGHGSGKSTFCRLVRYCLGEDSFAPDSQRNSMSSHFPEGYVGAEVILDSEPWVVLRTLGVRKRDVVIKNGTFADAFRAEEGTGIEPLRNAISIAIIGSAAALMPQAVGAHSAWEAALAWASRDQECRFEHHLDWRDSDSNSNSPVRGRSKDDLLAIVRALLGALTREEIVEKQREDETEKALTSGRSLSGKLAWQIARTRERLNSMLGGGNAAGEDLDAVALKSLATQKLEKVLKLPQDGTNVDLPKLRKELGDTRAELNRLESALSQNKVRVEEIGKRVTLMQSELPEAYATSIREENPVCPICRIPIDKTLAEGCGISTVSCDLEALRASIQSKKDAVEEAQNQAKLLRDQEQPMGFKIATLKQKIAPLEARVGALEKSILDRSSAVRGAERLITEAESYSELLTEHATVGKTISENELALERIKLTLFAHRDAASQTIANLSMRFDTIMRELIHADIRGEIKLDGKGMSLKIELGGERSTAAIDSLKVVAFDIAALTCTMEGKTKLPGFLLHDSPREADLGASIYRRLFELIKQLENIGEAPLFQYIVTTTTEPPEDCRELPWLRLQINGSPAEARLMKTDL